MNVRADEGGIAVERMMMMMRRVESSAARI